MYIDRGVVFIGLTDEGEAFKTKSEEFLQRNGVPWPSGYGAAETFAALGVRQYPTVFVIGADGKIAWNDEQETPLEDAIDAALAAAENG